MALAVLQIHNTPWLDSNWDTKDVGFIIHAAGASIALVEPQYISCSLSGLNGPPLHPKTHTNGRALAKNARMIVLGVALIELSNGQPLISQALPHELDAQGNKTPNTEMLVAARLVKDIWNRELDNYALATSCIQCDMGYPFDCGLDDEGFRGSFIERVICPLKEDYDQLFSKK
ncbi:Nn.00g111370.m01.CDS01 [Neocucurbitaria sp. VM-36]